MKDIFFSGNQVSCRLYINKGNNKFEDITEKAGISTNVWATGVSIADVNNDGYDDIYVCVFGKDLLHAAKNLLFINQHDLTFKEEAAAYGLDNTGYSTQAVFFDYDKDGDLDMYLVNYLLSNYNTNTIFPRDRSGHSPANDKLYRNDGDSSGTGHPFFSDVTIEAGIKEDGYGLGVAVSDFNNDGPFFSEIGKLAGIHATDWSWSVLLADFDNDGWKDMHITNGIGRDFINGDFLEFSNQVFNNNQTRKEQQEAIRNKLAALKHVNLPNYLYINQHNYTFTDASEKAGIDEPSMSNGAAYADLDNDGDLDLVVNNISKKAFVFINNTIQKNKSVTNHFLGLRLKGDSLNTRGFGTKVFVYNNSRAQMQEENPVRGYFSSVDQQLVFGLGKYDRVDSLVAIWPDNKKQVIKNITADTFLTLSWQNADENRPAAPIKVTTLFSDITSASGILYRHHDNSYNDFAIQRLLPQKYSQLGPFITTGDINNDGVADFFIGEGFNFSGKIFTQQKNHSFSSRNLVDSIKMEEDLDCILFDADNDGDSDLLITCGDIQFQENSVYYKPRLYVNDGRGNFRLQSNAIPASVKTIAGCVSAGDYDGDGDMDLFIGGRVSKNYPTPPRSFILENNKGVFTDVTVKVCPALQTPGMITSAVWADFDNDKQVDLIIAGEWMPVRFFKNNHSVLQEVTTATGLTRMNGMWRSLIAADIDNDGDPDLIAGNLGLNCDYNVSAAEPMQLFATDLDGNGSIDPVFFYYIKEKNGKKYSVPGIGRSQFSDQVPAIKKQFLLYKDYAHASFNEIFKGKTKDNLLQLHCEETRSCYFENIGNGKFIKHPLPIEAQFAPVNAIICDDLDGDGFKDLLLAGNEYQEEVITGRYDASYGCFLRGSSKKVFTPVSPVKSGFILKGDVKDMAIIRSSNGEKLILAAVNNDSLRVFRIARPRTYY